MNTVIESVHINRRYQLREIIGRGGMSVVYRAYDRLNKQDVALKRVIATDAHRDSTTISSEEMRLAMVQEFRLLASLRHPNIISVLDYGFDDRFEDQNGLPETGPQPYFTMDLLRGSEDILAAGRQLDTAGRIDLMLQMLQALTYLHRRKIIHRDLKPHNIMVTNQRLKLLDFGLSINRGAFDSRTAGTLAYMPPEILQGAPADEASDLYAVGILLFELFAGQHPYDTGDVMHLLEAVFAGQADFALMDAPEQVVSVTRQLMAIDKRARFQDTRTVIAELAAAIDKPLPRETSDIRESFLQAARMVGREREMLFLSSQLETTRRGQGSALLLGGESGVGKSRLVDELRTLALVRGLPVLRGQAVSEVSSTYHLWRGVVRWLCLMADINAEEAGILQAIVPDIGELLEIRPAAPSPIDPEAAQLRLGAVVVELFRRLTLMDGENIRPAVVLLEDLQWTGSEDLGLLKRLTLATHDLPLLVLGTFRDDEYPILSSLLPDMQYRHLERLDNASIAVLSESMLGEVGQQHEVLDLLRRETEGIPFFIIEVVRVLAEDAGRLDQIGSITLPEQVFAGGIRQIVQQRLNKVPPACQTLLRFAAVMGRELDLEVLRRVDSAVALESWLTLCSDAAVLDVANTDTTRPRWRFAHDKLREALLNEIPEAEREALHTQVASAIENTYLHQPGKLETYAPALAYHWTKAGNQPKERHYNLLAGEQALVNGAYAEAITRLSHAVSLYDTRITSPIERAHVLRQLGQAHLGLGHLMEGSESLQKSLRLLGFPLPEGRRMAPSLLVEVLRALSRLIPIPRRQASQAEGRIYLDAAGSYTRLAEIYYFTNDAALSIYASLRAMNIAEKAGTSPELARAYANLSVGASLNTLPLDWLSRIYGRRARRVAARLGHPSTSANVALTSGIYHAGRGHWQQAIDNLGAAADLFQGVRDIKRMEQSLTSLAHVEAILGNFERVIELNRNVYRSSARRGDPQMQGSALVWQAGAHAMMNQIDQAEALINEAFSYFATSPDQGLRIIGYSVMAMVLSRQKRIAEALDMAEKAIQVTSGGQPTSFSALPAYAGLGGMYLGIWQRSRQDDLMRIRSGTEVTLNTLHAYSRIFPIGWPITYLLQGSQLALLDQPKSARNQLRRALKTARKQNSPFFVALTNNTLGRLTTSPDERRAYLQDARTGFQNLRLLTYVRSIDKLLDSI